MESLLQIIGVLIYMGIIIFLIAALWKVYEKAGKPGWTAIVPIYNIVVLLEIVGRPLWWILLMFIPIANIVVSVIVYHDLSKAFGKDVGFTIGIIFLPFIFIPILGFGDAQYQNKVMDDSPELDQNI